MLSFRVCAAAAAMLMACRAQEGVNDTSAQDAGPRIRDGRVAVQTVDSQAQDPTLHYRCHARWSSFTQPAVLEEFDGAHWFCSQKLELESTEPIAILDDNSSLGAEFTQWRLDVGGVIVDVRLDTEWANIGAHGWREAEIEHVVYPEVSGRSARRVIGNRVERETDLIFATDSVHRVHFHYSDQFDRVAPVDLMIDRAHVPLCFKNRGCRE